MCTSETKAENEEDKDEDKEEVELARHPVPTHTPEPALKPTTPKHAQTSTPGEKSSPAPPLAPKIVCELF